MEFPPGLARLKALGEGTMPVEPDLLRLFQTEHPQ
jgi:hypothetical protein